MENNMSKVDLEKDHPILKRLEEDIVMQCQKNIKNAEKNNRPLISKIVLGELKKVMEYHFPKFSENVSESMVTRNEHYVPEKSARQTSVQVPEQTKIKSKGGVRSEILDEWNKGGK